MPPGRPQPYGLGLTGLTGLTGQRRDLTAPGSQKTGFGMAVAIFVDAVVIRLLIVPAAMQLVGRWTWWMPAPLARVLPKVKLEKS
ncbi:hypothetical protein OOK31_00235 [Streptomyces sp. NBC_00249]|uniref:hypothetical protein n=1 Tax=Streptomyces sp. NBC_00249 TaxID=2975690 RepID=UPI00224E14D0|nr:hypothetical protein [Streptomyces sp. NBC_00249]MCX5192330.1 hypothetical protein [Streptomyces sp. NBC_00249]